MKILDTVLEKRSLLTEKPSSIQCVGQYVKFEQLIRKRDADSLFTMSNGSPIQLNERFTQAYDPDDLIWRYMFEGPFKNVEQFIASLQHQVNASNGFCLCVFDVSTGRQIGVANLMNNYPSHLKIELGGIW